MRIFYSTLFLFTVALSLGLPISASAAGICSSDDIQRMVTAGYNQCDAQVLCEERPTGYMSYLNFTDANLADNVIKKMKDSNCQKMVEINTNHARSVVSSNCVLTGFDDCPSLRETFKVHKVLVAPETKLFTALYICVGDAKRAAASVDTHAKNSTDRQ